MPPTLKICTEESSSLHHAEIKCSSTWTIYDYSFSTVNDFHPVIVSPTFAGGCKNELKWNMKLFPLGVNEKITEYVSASVNFFEMDEFKEVYINCELSILNEKGELECTVKTKVLQSSDDEWIIENFIKKDYLIDNKNSILSNDKLVIVCKIIAHVYYEICDEELNYGFKVLSKSKVKVCKDIEKLLNDGSSSDILFIVDREKFHLHKAVLASRSCVFLAMFDNEMLEKTSNSVIITDISSSLFRKILQYIYSGLIEDISNLTYEVITELLIVADRYELGDLKNMCEIVLFNHLSFSNAIEMLKFADHYNAKNLKIQIIQFITAHNKSFLSDIELLSETHPSLLPQFIQERTNSKNNLDDSFYVCYDFDIEQLNKYMFIEGKCWGVTQLYVDKCSYTWFIDNFSFFLKNKVSNDIFYSQTFSRNYSEFEWQLGLCPGGVGDGKGDYISLYVKLKSEKSGKELKAQYEFIINNGHGELIKNVKSDVLIFFSNGEMLGESKLIKKDIILNDPKNDTLVITCKMISSSNNRNKLICQSDPMNSDATKYQLSATLDYENLLDSNKIGDITVIVGEKTYALHRSILTVRCPEFLKMIDKHSNKVDNKCVVEINDVPPIVMHELLFFIYTGDFENLLICAKELYVEATKYQILDLQDICETYLIQQLTVENVCDHFIFAHVNNFKNLKSIAVLFITNKLESVIKTPGYSSLADSRPQLLKDIFNKL